jgi:hypothetical protein
MELELDLELPRSLTWESDHLVVCWTGATWREGPQPVVATPTADVAPSDRAARRRDHQRQYMAEKRRRRTEDGRCVRCERPRDPRSRQVCTEHLLWQREIGRARYGVTRPMKAA